MRNGKNEIIKYLVNSLVLLFTIHCSLFTLSSCGGGDDDGRRLGDYIVGTWQRGWGEGDIIIEGNTELMPENLAYNLFIFGGDGTYNGMVRSGTFSALDVDGEIIYTGNYKCDNSTLKLEYVNENGSRQSILAQVLSFTETTLVIKYQNEEYNVSVTVTLRKGA